MCILIWERELLRRWEREFLLRLFFSFNEVWDYVMFLKAWGSGKYTPIQKKKRKGDGDNKRGRGGGRVLKL